MMERVATWNNMGTDVSGSKNLTEVLERSGLNFDVIKRPLYSTFNQDGKQKYIKLNNGMSATMNSQNGQVLGVVSNNYQIIQNREAFDFVDSMGDSITFEKAGQTSSGMMYIIARLADREILGDKYQPFVILQNSFNGGFSLRAAICPLRIVCQNQIRMALKEADNTVTIRHSGNTTGKMENAREVLMASDEYLKAMNKMAEKLATIKVSETNNSKIIDLLYPMKEDMNARSIRKIEDARSEFLAAYNAEDNQNFRNTLYGLVNAASDVDTHSDPSRKVEGWEERKFVYKTFSNGFYVPKVLTIADQLGLVA